MKKKRTALINLAIATLLISFFVACDKNFATIESDIINNDTATHFDATSMRFNVVTYNKKLDPVQTNNLPVDLLGVYNDPLYGPTTANVVAQIAPTSFVTTFGNNAVLDSVVLTIPYFSTSLEVTDSGETSIVSAITDSLYYG